MENFHWTCPFCNRNATITESDFLEGTIFISKNTKYDYQIFTWEIIICPNLSCKEFTFNLALKPARTFPSNGHLFALPDLSGETIKTWELIPQSSAKVFPVYIPQQLRNDYNEACAILKLSPKASATLSRRCLQGMIRDYWGIKNKGSLKQEIDAIQDKVDTLTWEAIEAIRTVGNIGAHMEKDVDLIIDVDPDEAEKLISLIEMLFEDWYIASHERAERLRNIKQIAADKTALKKAKTEPASA